MKRAIAIIVETILFLFVFLAGSLLVAVPASHLPSWDVNLSGTRYFVLDGLVFMAILYGLFLLIGAARHRGSPPRADRHHRQREDEGREVRSASAHGGHGRR